MATKYECDRCGQQTDKDNGIARISYPLVSRHSSTYNDMNDIRGIDLCRSCIIELNEFMKPIKESDAKT